MKKIKEAFHKVKEDFYSLDNKTDSIQESMANLKQEMLNLCNLFEKFNKRLNILETIKTSTHKPEKKTFNIYSSTRNIPLKPLEEENKEISTGNGGVSTDRQTDRQTDTKTQNNVFVKEGDKLTAMEKASDVLKSLNNIKKELRFKFKNLTEQEMLVFSTIYQLDEEKNPCDYKTLANKLNLTESSIRDYVGRLIKKGILIDKKKINNKTICLKISENLKKIAPLSTLLRLREI